MKKILLLLMAVVVCITVVAQKNKDSKRNMPFTESRTVGEFSALNVSSSFDVYIVDGDSPVLEIRSTHDVLKDITTEVIGGELVIKYKSPEKRWFNTDDNRKIMEVHISKSNLNAIRASGAADVYGRGTLVAREGNLEITASGASDVTLNVQVNGMLRCTASGSSDITLTGVGNDAEIIASGASDVDMKKYTLVNANVRASGSSDVDVNATGSLTLVASGASDVTYYGSPQHTNIKKSGSSDIAKR